MMVRQDLDNEGPRDRLCYQAFIFEERNRMDGDDDLCGVILVAAGADYLDLAFDAASSVRASNPRLPIDLFTDQKVEAEGAPFSQIHQASPPAKLMKLTCLKRTRFQRTLYLDCDTRVVRPVDDLFRVLDQFELAIAHDVRRASSLIQTGWREDAPYAFPQHNSGVLLYRKSPETAAFLTRWVEDFSASGASRDQVALRDLLWKSDLRYYVLPPEFNLRRVTSLDAWEPLDALPTIFHSHIFLRHLREPGTPKVSEIAEVIEIERRNLILEWERAGRPAFTPPRAEPEEQTDE